MVDFGGNVRAGRTLYDLLNKYFRPGDIFTHMYGGRRGEQDPETKGPSKAMIDGRKRGVIFDVGHGGGSFLWSCAIPLMKAGFIPDSISTDLHYASMNAGMKDMLNVMDKFLAHGHVAGRGDSALHLESGEGDPARGAGQPLGRIAGRRGGAAPGEGQLRIRGPDRRPLRRHVETGCELTVRDGNVVYDLNGMTRGAVGKSPAPGAAEERETIRTRPRLQPAAFARTSRKRRATIVSSPGSSIQTPTTIVFSSVGRPARASSPGGGIQFNARSAAAQLRRHVERGDLHALLVVTKQQVRDRVGRTVGTTMFDSRVGMLLSCAAMRSARWRNSASHGVVRLGEEPIHRRNHADDLFLGHFHAAPDGVGSGLLLLDGRGDQIFPSQQQSGVLRTAHALAARERDQVEAHLRVVPQIRDRRNVGGRIVEARYAVAVRHANPILAADLPCFRGVEEMRHDGAIVEGRLVLGEVSTSTKRTPQFRRA